MLVVVAFGHVARGLGGSGRYLRQVPVGDLGTPLADRASWSRLSVIRHGG